MIIGLTGTLGSGKTEAAKILKKLGAQIVSADEIGHGLFVPGSSVWRAVVQAFGQQVLSADSEINRKKLGEIVFSDPKKLAKLNGIMHPRIRKEINEQIKSCKSSVVSCKLLIIDAALPHLFKGVVDETWVVDAPKETRIKRLLKSGLTKIQINKRMKSQLPQSSYLKIADVVILNDGSKEKLKEAVDAAFALSKPRRLVAGAGIS